MVPTFTAGSEPTDKFKLPWFSHWRLVAFLAPFKFNLPCCQSACMVGSLQHMNASMRQAYLAPGSVWWAMPWKGAPGMSVADNFKFVIQLMYTDIIDEAFWVSGYFEVHVPTKNTCAIWFFFKHYNTAVSCFSSGRCNSKSLCQHHLCSMYSHTRALHESHQHCLSAQEGKALASSKVPIREVTHVKKVQAIPWARGT